MSSPPLPDLQVDAAFLPLDINQIIDNSPVCDSNYINQLPDDDDFSLRTKVTQHYRQQKKHHQQYYQGDENPIEQFGDRYEHQEDNNFDEDCDEEEGVPVALQFTEHSNQVHQQRVPFQHVENHPEAMARPKRTTTQGGKGVTGSGKGAKKPKTSSNSRSLQALPSRRRGESPTNEDTSRRHSKRIHPDSEEELHDFEEMQTSANANRRRSSANGKNNSRGRTNETGSYHGDSDGSNPDGDDEEEEEGSFLEGDSNAAADKFDEVANENVQLKAQLAKSQAMVNATKGHKNQAVAEEIYTYTRNVMCRDTKFIDSTDTLWKKTMQVLEAVEIKGKEKWDTHRYADACVTYKQIVSRAVCDDRNYKQSQLRGTFLGLWLGEDSKFREVDDKGIFIGGSMDEFITENDIEKCMTR